VIEAFRQVGREQGWALEWVVWEREWVCLEPEAMED